MFKPREIERARFEEIEDNSELKVQLGLSSAPSYVAYFDENYEHVGLATIQNWINKRKKNGSEPIDKEFDDFLKVCRKAGESGKNSRYADLYAQLKGWKQKPKEETRDGFSPAELIKIGQQVRQALIDEYRSGCCPICGLSQTFHVQSLGEGREQSTEDTLAAVELPS